MKALHPRWISTAAIVGLGLAAVVPCASAQVVMKDNDAEQLKPKDPSTPQLLITTFRMSSGVKPGDAKIGYELAEQLREKLGNIASEKELFVVPLTVINGDLKLAGYKPDSAVQTAELLQLGTVVGAAETIDGTVTRLPSGMIEFTPTFYRKNNPAVAEPFGPVVGKDAGDVAKKFAEMYKAMRKELPLYQKCESGLYAQKYDEATAGARATIAAYPGSNIGRLCLISAFSYGKAPADSIIRVGLEILAHDSTSSISLGLLRDAYVSKGDQAKAAEYAVRIYNLNPSSKADAESAINALVNSGAPQSALPIINQVIQTDPTNKTLYLQKLGVQLRLHKYDDAYQTADTVMKIDTAAATLDLFKQMIGAAQLDSNVAMQIKYSEQAAKRFPKDATLQMALYSMLNKAGRQADALEAAKRAFAADPKVPDGITTIIGLDAALGKVDDALAFAKAAIAGGADPATIGPALANAAGPALKAAQSSTKLDPTKIDDWKTALALVLKIDSIAPSQNSKYYIGVAAFSIIQPTGQAIIDNQKDKVKACELTRYLKEMIVLVNLNMMAGAKFDASSAAQILTAVPQYEATVPQYEKAFCGGGLH